MRPKVIFMGTPPFALTILKALHAQDVDIVAVYSQPPRQSGRGHHVIKSPVHLYAEEAGLPVFTPVSFKEARDKEAFCAQHADVAVVAAYGLLLPRAILEAPRRGCVNVHGSLLPRWRGAAPVQYALMEGDSETGVCLMKMDVGMDTGPVFAKAQIPLEAQDTTPVILEKLAHLGAELVCLHLNSYLQGQLSLYPQSDVGITYAPKISKDRGVAHFDAHAVSLERRVRALTPVPGVWFVHEGRRIKVLEARVEEPTTIFPSEAWGVVQDSALGIACAQGLFRPTLIQKEGAKAQDTASFLRGYMLPPGTRLNDGAV